eukprot:2709440-Rhodomonas_salina.1
MEFTSLRDRSITAPPCTKCVSNLAGAWSCEVCEDGARGCVPPVSLCRLDSTNASLTAAVLRSYPSAVLDRYAISVLTDCSDAAIISPSFCDLPPIPPWNLSGLWESRGGGGSIRTLRGQQP